MGVWSQIAGVFLLLGNLGQKPSQHDFWHMHPLPQNSCPKILPRSPGLGVCRGTQGRI